MRRLLVVVAVAVRVVQMLDRHLLTPSACAAVTAKTVIAAWTTPARRSLIQVAPAIEIAASASAATTAVNALKLVAVMVVARPMLIVLSRVRFATTAAASQVRTVRVPRMPIVHRERGACYNLKTVRVFAAPCVSQATNAPIMNLVSRLQFASPISAKRRIKRAMPMVPAMVCV